VLESISLRSVTNFRVSTDYYYGYFWDTGLSSLLVWALGAAPSKVGGGRTGTVAGLVGSVGCFHHIAGEGTSSNHF
jgi:hypothetical protein